MPTNPAQLKVKQIFTLVRTIKITHYPREWLRHLSLTRPEGLRKWLRGEETKKTWTLNAYRSSFVYCSNRLLRSYFPPLCRADWSSSEMLEKMAAVSWELLIVPQEVDLSPSSRKVPWGGLLPTSRKAYFNSLGLLHKNAPNSQGSDWFLHISQVSTHLKNGT